MSEEINKEESTNNTINATKLESLKALSGSNFIIWLVLVALSFLGTIVILFPGMSYLLLILPIAFCGSLFSLFFAKKLIIKSHNVQLISENNPNNSQMQNEIYTMLTELAKDAGLEKCPEVGIYDSPDMNAFATGRSHSDCLVAFSTGLLNNMPMNEVRAVAAHEVGHIVNRDMLGTVLIQGFINTVVFCFTFPLRFLAFMFRIMARDSLQVIMYYATALFTLVVNIVLNFFGKLLSLAFSRHREYKADKFAATLVNSEDMSSALQRLSGDTALAPIAQAEYAAFKVSGKIKFSEFLSTHPDINKRIEALKENK